LIIIINISAHRKFFMTLNNGIKQSVQQAFANAAANYSTSTVHASGADLATMVQSANLTSETVVLDAGCGAGHTALAFAPHVQRVIAYDLTPPMLAQVEKLATERGITNVQTQQGDVEHLPYDAASFDLIVSRYSAHHWVQPEAALREFARVLKPGGQFILSDVVAPDGDYTADTFLQTLELLRDPSHVRDHAAQAWLTMLEDAGFGAEVVTRFDIPLHFGQWLQRIGTPPVLAQAIRALMLGAPQEMKRIYQLPQSWTDDEFEFMIYGAVIRATKH
jgi:ubiquinone/menaquinone biosynthesis C-methylase UbiE